VRNKITTMTPFTLATLRTPDGPQAALGVEDVAATAIAGYALGFDLLCRDLIHSPGQEAT
jgi:hypothetical protein